MRKVLVLLIAVAALASCGKSGKGIKMGEAVDTVGNDASYSLHAANQTTSNGNAIKTPEVYCAAKCWLTIHADANGAPGPILGTSELLDAGENENVRVKLTKKLTETADVWPMVHLEDNNNTTYDFPKGDKPATVDDKVVVAKIHVTVR
jgi:hypothetical protein